MTTELVKFTNEEFGEITTIEIDGEVWFLGKDITNILGYTNPTKAFKDHVDEEDRKTLKFKASNESLKASLWSGNDYSDKTLINESGIYALIFGSKLESAKRFKKWVTSEVLPSIRKTGAYGEVKPALSEKDQLRLKLFSNDPVEVAAANKTLVELETRPLKNKIEFQTAELEEQRPKVEVYDNFIDKSHTLGFRELRKEIESTSGIRVKENRLREILRELKIINPSNIKATAYAIRKGLAVTKDIDLDIGTKTQDRFKMSARDLVLEYVLDNQDNL